MTGLFFSVAAGILMSIQGTFNTRVTEVLGVNLTNLLVQGLGFLVMLAVSTLSGGFGGLKNLGEVNKLYLLGGIIGVIIVYTVIKGIDSLGVTTAILLILLAQLSMAAAIDYFGLFGTEKVAFAWNKWLGLLLMIGGILFFQGGFKFK
ncbi:MAG: DMT family transporter [bacterium]